MTDIHHPLVFPRPWKRVGHVVRTDGGRPVVVGADHIDETDLANASFIVRACNAHDALVDALSQLLQNVEDTRQDFCGLPTQVRNSSVDAGRAALALARGEPS